MREIGILVSIFVSLAVAIILPLVLAGGVWKAAQEKARTRRLVDAKMNARLLKFHL